MGLQTEKFYTIEELIKKIQSTNIKFNFSYEFNFYVKNPKALQRDPLIIILGEEHAGEDAGNESYYKKDLEKLEKLSNILEIKNIFLEGIAKGEENNVEKTILNAEINLIKTLSKNKNYTIYGVENLDIQIKIMELDLLLSHLDCVQLVNNTFSSFFNDQNLYYEIRSIFESIFENISKKINQTIIFKPSMKLYLIMKQTGVNYSEIFNKVKIYYTKILFSLNRLNIYPKNHNEFNYEIVKIVNKSGFNLNVDKSKIEKLHFNYVLTLRDQIFTKNILESIKENNISKSIFFCGLLHMKTVTELLKNNSEKFLNTKINVITINITSESFKIKEI